MRATRLSLALETGTVVLPASGRILVLGPTAGDDLSALPVTRIVAVQGFRPDFDALLARGVTVGATVPDDRFAMALVCLPRARDAARAMVAAACDRVGEGGLVVVDGQKTDGVEGLHRDLRRLLPGVTDALSKAHGKLFTFPAAPLPADWTGAPRRIDGGFVTAPGVFSADRPDPGSALLAAALPAQMKGRGIDLGAGWGFLSRAALTRSDALSLDLVEADHAALDCARVNITDPRASFHWADATAFRPARPAHWIVCNPPFHAGRVADPAIGAAFLTAAARMLVPDGTLWLVANRHLPYDRVLSPLFREVQDLPGTPAFRLTRASRPFPPNRR
ncbi:MAG: class I SAM-dependent methyltransferase [Gemmobacter sp.]